MYLEPLYEQMQLSPALICICVCLFFRHFHTVAPIKPKLANPRKIVFCLLLENHSGLLWFLAFDRALKAKPKKENQNLHYSC